MRHYIGMYTIISQNIDCILGNINEDLDIRTYLFLLKIFRNVNVSIDAEFQEKYCRYWRLFGAGLSREFRSKYFELMEKSKGRPLPGVGEVARLLYEIPSNSLGRKTLQFSFASKLLHTLEPHRPIYDSMIATFYSFKAPIPTKSLEFRLGSFLLFYDYLVKEYETVLNNQTIQQAIADFRHRFSLPDEYTDEKIIDTLIWRAMDLWKKGFLLPQPAIHSESVEVEDEKDENERRNSNMNTESASIRAIEIIKSKFSQIGDSASIPKRKGGSFKAKITKNGINVDNLGTQPFLPWKVFEEAVRLMSLKGGRAQLGNAMEARLGQPGLLFDSIEGCIASKVYDKKAGDSVFRRITPISNILIWADVCRAAHGELILL